MTDSIGRREFVARAIALAVIGRVQPTVPVVHIAVVTPTTSTDRYRGALLGAEEAEHAAKMFGGSVSLVRVANSSDAKTVTAFIGGDSLSSARALTAHAKTDDALFLNVGCTSDELRGSACASHVFHIAPSDAMLNDAKALAAGATSVAVWDPSLVRFGADTLNDRFRARFGVAMAPDAWTAWFAVKVLWESSLRMKSANAAQLADYLTRDTTQFDGHKGRPLSFRLWDHQLRQFLYTRIDGKPVDIPRSAAPDASSRDVLDGLGTTAANTTCHL